MCNSTNCYCTKSDLLRALIQFPRASRERFMCAPSTILLPLFKVLAARSDPARSMRNNLPILTSCTVFETRLRWRTVIWRTACDRDDVLLAAVGSWVRCLFPWNKMSITWNIPATLLSKQFRMSLKTALKVSTCRPGPTYRVGGSAVPSHVFGLIVSLKNDCHRWSHPWSSWHLHVPLNHNLLPPHCPSKWKWTQGSPPFPVSLLPLWSWLSLQKWTIIIATPRNAQYNSATISSFSKCGWHDDYFATSLTRNPEVNDMFK